jgi:hypothetical protein
MINPAASLNIEVELSENGGFIIRSSKPETVITQSLVGDRSIPTTRNRLKQTMYTATSIDEVLQIIREQLEKEN